MKLTNNNRIGTPRPARWPALAMLAALIAVSGCSRIDAIPYCCPEQTPEAWCDSRPCSAVSLGELSFTLAEPSSTAIVYFLGILTVAVGLVFFRAGAGRSRWWWGVSLLLWGLATFSAGTSYQGFSYEIKCAGHETCRWTSWWEIVYLLLEVASLDAMLVAVACAGAGQKWRRRLVAYAGANLAAYGAVVLAGAFIPVQFLISFELLVLFATPNVFIFLALNLRGYLRRRSGQDLALLGAWLSLGAITGIYFLYLVTGMTEKLWAGGVWFSANDVLHVGLIVWMIYLALVVARRVEDAP